MLCVEPIYPQYSGVLETCLALRYWFFEVLGSESVKAINYVQITGAVQNMLCKLGKQINALASCIAQDVY